jgi:hypothetical protein
MRGAFDSFLRVFRISMVAGIGLMAVGACRAQEEANPQVLKFTDFYRQPVGPRGLEPSERLASSAGRQVTLRGWMVAQELPSAGYFLLTPRPLRLSEHADGDADDLPPATVLVRLPAGRQSQAWPHQAGLIDVVGRLSVGRALEADGRISWIQIQLE